MSFWKKAAPAAKTNPTPAPPPTKPPDYDGVVRQVKAAIAEQGPKGSCSIELPEAGTVVALKVKLEQGIAGWRGGPHADPEGRENWVQIWWNINTTVQPKNPSGTVAWAPELRPRYLEVVHNAVELRESALGAVLACAGDDFRARFITNMGIVEVDFDAVNAQLAADVASYDPRLAGMRWRVHRSADAMDLLIVDRQETESVEDQPRHHPV